MSPTSRYAVHPREFKTMTTEQLRSDFLIDNLFAAGEITFTYTHYDRMIVGGAQPAGSALELPNPTQLKANYFLERRELGIINVGGAGKVVCDGKSFELGNKEALFIGQGTKQVVFHPGEKGQAPLYYFNSAPAHTAYPTRKISLAEAETVEMGSIETSNHRIIRKLIVNSVVKSCQLQMGLTELKTGSVWNTMPPHTHDRRMEVYFYFELPENQRVCHFIGEPQETRHLWLKNHQAVLSPPWSIHSGAGTSNYAFIWSMAGENLDYADMDQVSIPELK